MAAQADALTAAITVVIADDHPMWRDAVARDLIDAGMRVVGTAADGVAAVHRTIATRPDVLVLDLNMPGLTGPQVCEQIAAAGVATRVLVLSASGEPADVARTVRAGAAGYLVKSTGREEFVEAVRRIAGGRPAFTPGIATGAPAEGLTEREQEIVRLVATGLSSKEIAARLFISHRTVQNHVQNVLGKLALRNRVELARYALDHGL